MKELKQRNFINIIFKINNKPFFSLFCRCGSLDTIVHENGFMGSLAWLVTWYSTCLRNKPFFSGMSSTWTVSRARSLSSVWDTDSTSS